MLGITTSPGPSSGDCSVNTEDMSAPGKVAEVDHDANDSASLTAGHTLEDANNLIETSGDFGICNDDVTVEIREDQSAKLKSEKRRKREATKHEVGITCDYAVGAKCNCYDWRRLIFVLIFSLSGVTLVLLALAYFIEADGLAKGYSVLILLIGLVLFFIGKW